MLQRHYTRTFEAQRERGRKLSGWYCWGHGTCERSCGDGTCVRSQRCTHSYVSQSHALLSITVLNTVYVYKYFVRNFASKNNKCTRLGFFSPFLTMTPLCPVSPTQYYRLDCDCDYYASLPKGLHNNARDADPSQIVCCNAGTQPLPSASPLPSTERSVKTFSKIWQSGSE